MASRRPPLLLLLVAAAVALSSLPRTASSQPTDPADVAAMQALSTALGADETLGWSKTTDPCGGNWPHVACFAGRVTRIQIGNQSLAGTLPAGIANLTALEVFELMSNQISGPLPSLSGLSALQRILFHHNAFTSIPAGFFSGLTALQNVSLDHNPFAAWRIPDDLKAATSLVTFSASNASVVGPIPDFLATDFPGLIALSLSHNSLSGGIPRSFAGSTIRSLWLNGIAPGTGLSGGIEVIGNMTSLTQLWLQSNAFTGPLPDFSGLTSLNDLNLRDNRLTGPVPNSLTSLKSLQSVTLTNNLLQGPVPQFDEKVKLDLNPSSESFCRTDTGDCDTFVNVLLSIASSFGYPIKFAANWKGNNTCSSWLGVICDARGNITVVNFSNMGLNGTISPDFAKLTALQTLVLSGNNLTGTIPSSLVSLNHLKLLDVSNNALSEPVPSFNKDVKVNTDGNPNIGKGKAHPPIPSPGGPEKGNDTGKDPNPGSPADYRKDGEKSSASKLVVGCVIGGGICGVLLISSLCFCYRRRIQHISGGRQSVKATVIHPQHSCSEREMVKISLTSGLNGGKGSGSEVYSLASSGTGDLQVGDSRNLVISIQVLRNATDNFSEENILGRGGFGTVYKGRLLDGTLVAVKRMESGVMGSKGLQEFKSEIDVLTKVRHRHLVSLLGYCLDENEKILVYEYMPMGTLSHHLFNWMNVGFKPLTWKRRLSIALDVARGVEYLHSMAHQSFIHRDLKPSNILLGDDMKAKVADFGLVRHAPDGQNCSVQTRIAGTFGYLAPEYAVTGRVTTRADVYSFGVILMELITGRKALDENQAEESMHLVTWFRRMLISKESFRKAIDPAIKFDEDEETLASISTVAELAGYCCAREPYQRPDMGHAVNVLSSLAELWKPTRPTDNMDVDSGIDFEMPLPQMLKEWQALENSQSDSYTQSFLQSSDNTQGSIPTRPVAFAESFTSADGR